MAKISVSLDDELYRRVRDAAGAESVSGWLAAAAASRLRMQGLAETASEIAESTGGPYSAAELAEARAWLPSSSTQAA